MKLPSLIYRVCRPAVGPLLAVLLAGCHLLPSTRVPMLPGQPSIVGIAGDPVRFPGSPVVFPSSNASPAVAGSQTSSVFQSLANAIARGAWVIGLGCLALAGLAGYSGRLLTTAKLAALGIVLIFGGTWFAWHWRAVLCGLLALGAVACLNKRWVAIEERLKAYVEKI